MLNAFKQKITGLTLVPSRGGCFELKADGELLYSKLATGQFPDESDMIEKVGSKLKK